MGQGNRGRVVLDAEASMVQGMRVSLGEQLTNIRIKRRMTQAQVAALLETSQSRVAFAEAGKPDVSLEFLIRGLLKLGDTPRSIGLAIMFVD